MRKKTQHIAYCNSQKKNFWIPSDLYDKYLRIKMFRYILLIIFTLFFCSISEMVSAGRIDYSRLSDEELKITVIFTICLLVLSAIIAIIAWIRYVRSYQPGPGLFTPMQVLVIVLILVLCAVIFALTELQII